MGSLIEHGEDLLVPERMIVAPAAGVFRAIELDTEIELKAGQTVGLLDGLGTSVPIVSPFAGNITDILVQDGERLREGQPVAWLRVN